jgi:hypothetical protein
MAYVVARRDGRFEIRESLHTPRGPRARSLAGFETLTDGVLARAAARATRPFDAGAVIASAKRARAAVMATADAGPGDRYASRRFVEASRRMARSLSPRRVSASLTREPGDALIELLGFADAVTRSQPARPFKPLAFPVLATLVADRRAAAASR